MGELLLVIERLIFYEKKIHRSMHLPSGWKLEVVIDSVVS